MNKKIEELIKLTKENPDMEITVMVETEVCHDNSFAYWRGIIARIEIDTIWQPDETTFIGDEEITDEIYNNICDDLPDDLTDDERQRFIEKEYKDYVKKGEIKKHIIIYIEP